MCICMLLLSILEFIFTNPHQYHGAVIVFGHLVRCEMEGEPASCGASLLLPVVREGLHSVFVQPRLEHHSPSSTVHSGIV